MIKENLQSIRATIPEGVTLVAVSKFHPVEALQEAYDAGQRIFGESRSSAKVVRTSSRPRLLLCPTTSSGTSSDICRPTR